MMPTTTNPIADRIGEALGLPSDPAALAPPVSDARLPATIDDAGERQSIVDDFEAARANTYKMIDKAQIALDGVISLAHTLESPRAYEVVATLINTINDANKGLLELQEKRKKLLATAPAGNKEGDVNITQNNVFTGSAKELFEMMRSQNGSASYASL